MDQGQYNSHMMHSHVWGSHHAKFDDDDFNSFQGITCEGHTHTLTQAFDLSHLSKTFFEVVSDIENKKSCGWPLY